MANKKSSSSTTNGAKKVSKTGTSTPTKTRGNVVTEEKKTPSPSGEQLSKQTKALLDCITGALLDKKAKDVVVLDLRGLTTLADQFVVCHGTSETQIKALADNVTKETSEKLGEKAWKREGFDSRRWIILDYVNVVVHIFSQEKRDYYGIERMWNDAVRTEVVDAAPAAAGAVSATTPV